MREYRGVTDPSKMEANARVVSLAISLILINWNRENVFCNSQYSIPSRLIFEENFDSNILNKNVWTREIKIPTEPDYEFAVYHKHDDTVSVSDGILRIKPRLFEDEYGEDSIRVGQLRLADCSSSIPEECQQQASSFHILPPVISAKLITRNHFHTQYGIIEVRAKFPEGDWLYPEIWMESLYKSYDRRFANARIDLGRVRGNAVLRKPRADHELGSRLLEFGVANGTGLDFAETTVSSWRSQNKPWNHEFHTYKTRWAPEGFTFYVDDRVVGRLIPTANGWSTKEDALAVSMAPFDERFYLSIGLGAGGVRVFPDGTQTNTYVKPWKNINAKAMLLFWQAKDLWLPSWTKNKGENSALEIDFIKVWTLDRNFT